VDWHSIFWDGDYRGFQFVDLRLHFAERHYPDALYQGKMAGDEDIGGCLPGLEPGSRLRITLIFLLDPVSTDCVTIINYKSSNGNFLN